MNIYLIERVEKDGSEWLGEGDNAHVVTAPTETEALALCASVGHWICEDIINHLAPAAQQDPYPHICTPVWTRSTLVGVTTDGEPARIILTTDYEYR